MPNNATLALSGDFDRKKALALVEKYFGPIPRGPEVPRKKPAAVPGATPPAAAETPKSANKSLLRAESGAISTEEIRTLAARLEAEANVVRSMQINDDEAKYTAIAQCAAS